jgi:hypothetical protein
MMNLAPNTRSVAKRAHLHENLVNARVTRSRVAAASEVRGFHSR